MSAERPYRRKKIRFPKPPAMYFPRLTEEERAAVQRRPEGEAALARFLAARPAHRADCAGGERPCPYVRCDEHVSMGLNPHEPYSLSKNFVSRHLDELEDTYVRDTVDHTQRPLTSQEIQRVTGCREDFVLLGIAYLDRRDVRPPSQGPSAQRSEEHEELFARVLVTKGALHYRVLRLLLGVSAGPEHLLTGAERPTQWSPATARLCKLLNFEFRYCRKYGRPEEP